VLVPDGGGGAELLTGVAPRTWKDNAYFFKVWRLDAAQIATLAMLRKLEGFSVPRSWKDNAYLYVLLLWSMLGSFINIV